jgi:hypothetical protein
MKEFAVFQRPTFPHLDPPSETGATEVGGWWPTIFCGLAVFLLDIRFALGYG